MAERKLPKFDELPKFHEYTGCAWEVWGKEDELGTVNLLTDQVTAEAAKEIKEDDWFELAGQLPLESAPLFHRKSPSLRTFVVVPSGIVNDDEIYINTQSGTQWDGPKHFGILKHLLFYNNTPVSALHKGELGLNDPAKVDPSAIRLGIHNWAQHGIVGRGVLLDLVKFYTDNGTKPLPYDPWTTHAIPARDLEACAKQQGVTFKQGDILIMRVGFIDRYNTATQEERDGLAGKPETFAGLEQSEDVKRFLWDNHFAAIASDQPAIESWPPREGGEYLHETFLGLWGMPIGEMFDLEKLAKYCNDTGRYTFFFTSWPLNILGGVASPPNAAAYF